MQNFCAALDCSSAKSDEQPLFRFPKDDERCKKWLEICHRKDLEDKTPEQLYKYYRLCAKHFETSVIEINDLATVLKDGALPTVFEMSGQSHNGQLKRPKEMHTGNDEKESKRTNKMKNDDSQTSPEVEYKEELKALFEVLLLLGKQNIPVKEPADENLQMADSGNFQALLECHVNAGDAQKKLDEGSLNEDSTLSAPLNQLIEVCERYIRHELVEEVKKNGFFSLVTEDLVRIMNEWHLPVFLRYVDQANCQQEKFVGFLCFEGEEEALIEKLLSELTEKWGLNMEYCRGQAHSGCGIHSGKIKAFATKLTEKYPLAVVTPRSTCSLNISLADGMQLSGVQLVMTTFKKIESFFSHSPSLQLELEHAISIFYTDKDKAMSLKEICRTNWTRRHDAFEIAVDIIESLLLCVDSVHDNEDMRWSDQVMYDALEISKVLADFEFIMALIVLKNILSLTRAFAKNLQGGAADAYFAANSSVAVLHSLVEVSENIDVYHEFWHEEAINLAAALEIPVKVPRAFLRKSESEGEIVLECYYKQHLSVPVVSHVLQEMKVLFSENHLKALRCLLLVPAVLGQNKSKKPQEECIDLYKTDIPNTTTLSAELECWWVKWSHKGKDDAFSSSLHQTLQLPDVKFFPNMLAVLRVIGTLPTFVLEENTCEAHKRFKAYIENTTANNRSRSLALLNVHFDVKHDLDILVSTYIKAYPDMRSRLA